MHGLDLTFATLGKTRNAAAVDALMAAVTDPRCEDRRGVVTALMCRSEPRAAQLLMAHWSRLSEPDIELLRTRKAWISTAIEQAMDAQPELGIAAAEAVGLTSALPKLILLAESAASRSLRLRASEAVQRIIVPLGNEARNDRDQPSVRSPIVTRLADSLRRFSMHRNEQLVIAYLVVVAWGDNELRQLLSETGPASDLLCKHMSESTHPGVVDLLVGFLRRRNVPERVLRVLRTREDVPFRDSFLRAIGCEPSQIVLKNLRDIGMPRCCCEGESMLEALPIDCRSALVHVHVMCNSDYVESLHLVAATAMQGTRDCVTAATSALSRCEVPNADSWMRAALHLPQDGRPSKRDDETARLLKRFIHLLNDPDAALQRAIRKSLTALHADEALPRFQSLRPRSRRRLGQVVMSIDGEAIERVRDALRHPVLTKRLEAIAMADALGAVDLLYESFAHITREDHQEARMRAAEAMSNATSEETLHLLEEMLDLPECPVRDTAILAIQRRMDLARLNRSPSGKLTSHADGSSEASLVHGVPDEPTHEATR